VRSPFSPESVIADFTALLKTYRIDRVHGDRHAGEWPRKQFAKAGIIYQPSERSKSEIYRDALPLLKAGKQCCSTCRGLLRSCAALNAAHRAVAATRSTIRLVATMTSPTPRRARC
jgi:hypothetical protein